jgi:hypothetical protein
MGLPVWLDTESKLLIPAFTNAPLAVIVSAGFAKGPVLAG